MSPAALSIIERLKVMPNASLVAKPSSSYGTLAMVASFPNLVLLLYFLKFLATLFAARINLALSCIILASRACDNPTETAGLFGGSIKDIHRLASIERVTKNRV